MYLDHITIRTHELELNKDFLISIFDLAEGPRPASIIASVDGHWLYAMGSPLLHLIRSRFPTTGKNQEPAEAIDHFAFLMKDYTLFKQKLTEMQIPFELNDLPELNRKRIFFRTPSNILIETIFDESINSTGSV